MSCDEWLRGSYWIRNKTEFNKLIKAVVKGYNKEIAEINEAIKEYKATVKSRSAIDWAVFNKLYRVDGGNWRIYDLIEEHWKRRGGLPKATNKSIDIDSVRFDRDNNLVIVEVTQNNWAVERWWCMPGVNSLFENLSNVKWSQRGDKDGGYLSYWNEYYTCEGNGEPTFQHYFGRKGKETQDWQNKRPW